MKEEAEQTDEVSASLASLKLTYGWYPGRLERISTNQPAALCLKHTTVKLKKVISDFVAKCWWGYQLLSMEALGNAR